MKSEDIARLAGVSRSTVSRVINGYTNVPENTRKKVLKVIEKYNYQPNTSARILAGKSNNTIGLFVTSISDNEEPNRIYQSSYYSSFINAVVDTANTIGYYVLVHTIYSPEDYSKISQTFSQKRISGGIIVGNEKNSRAIKGIAGMGFPIGIVDYDPGELKKHKIDSSNLIIFNSMDFEGTAKVIEYLIESGHRDIGIITGRLDTYSGRQRYEAYKSTLLKNGINVPPEFILKGDFIKKNTYEEVRKLIHGKKLPTALFACNDDMAIGAMEVFMEQGIRIPEDISIIGFDDIPMASYIKPSLSTVRIPVYEMVTGITEYVINNIGENKKGLITKDFPTEFIRRDTCKAFN